MNISGATCPVRSASGKGYERHCGVFATAASRSIRSGYCGKRGVGAQALTADATGGGIAAHPGRRGSGGRVAAYLALKTVTLESRLSHAPSRSVTPESHQNHTRITPESHQNHTRITLESRSSHAPSRSVTPESRSAAAYSLEEAAVSRAKGEPMKRDLYATVRPGSRQARREKLKEALPALEQALQNGWRWGDIIELAREMLGEPGLSIGAIKNIRYRYKRLLARRPDLNTPIPAPPPVARPATVAPIAPPVDANAAEAPVQSLGESAIARARRLQQQDKTSAALAAPHSLWNICTTTPDRVA